MKRLLLLLPLITLLGAWIHGSSGGGGGGGAPVVSSTSFVISSPVTNGGAVGSASCSLNCTGLTWSITAGNSAGNFAINSSTGAITTTATGVTNLVNNNDTFTLTVQASNGGNGSNTTTINSYLDGFPNAPAGTAQQATLLNGYATRAPWKVAGVDYAIGPQSTPSTNPNTIPTSSCTICRSGTTITVGGSNQTLDGYDFSGSNWQVSITGTGATITNNKWVQTADVVPVSVAASAGNWRVAYNYMDGGGQVSFLISANSMNGQATIEYNYLLNTGSDNFSLSASNNATSYSAIIRYNLAVLTNDQVGAHADLLQVGSGIRTDMEVLFSTWYVNNPPQGTQGLGVADGTSGSSNTTINVLYNTGVGKGTVGSLGFLVGGKGGGVTANSATISNNYYDPTASTSSQFYSTNTIPSGWTSKNNTNMVTGLKPAAWNN